MKMFFYFTFVFFIVYNVFVYAEIKTDPITGERVVETEKNKLASYSTINVFGTQVFFEGTPHIAYKFMYKNNKKYLLLEYKPAYLATSKAVDFWFSDSDDKITDDVATYKVQKMDRLWIKVGENIVELKADNNSFSDKRGFLPFVYYDITSIDFSKELVSFIRTEIKYGQTKGELNAEIKQSLAKKFKKEYINFEKKFLN